MAIKKFNPTSAGMRHRSILDNSDLTKKRPEKSLVEPLHSASGHNSRGVITSWHKSGGNKKLYRIIDFKRNKDDIKGKVIAIEYDPNRNCRIALIGYLDGEKRYIIAPAKLIVGSEIMSGEECEIRIGNAMPLKNIPVGTNVYNIEARPRKGGQIARAAGVYAQITGREGEYIHLKMPSGELKKIHRECRATVGEVGNADAMNVTIGKAGKSRWLGIRPTVRGVVMNPVDHPHGGGEGKTGMGRHPVTPWGKPTKGARTRNNKRTDGTILRRRKK